MSQKEDDSYKKIENEIVLEYLEKEKGKRIKRENYYNKIKCGICPSCGDHLEVVRSSVTHPFKTYKCECGFFRRYYDYVQ